MMLSLITITPPSVLETPPAAVQPPVVEPPAPPVVEPAVPETPQHDVRQPRARGVRGAAGAQRLLREQKSVLLVLNPQRGANRAVRVEARVLALVRGGDVRERGHERAEVRRDRVRRG